MQKMVLPFNGTEGVLWLFAINDYDVFTLRCSLMWLATCNNVNCLILHSLTNYAIMLMEFFSAFYDFFFSSGKLQLDFINAIKCTYREIVFNAEVEQFCNGTKGILMSEVLFHAEAFEMFFWNVSINKRSWNVLNAFAQRCVQKSENSLSHCDWILRKIFV